MRRRSVRNLLLVLVPTLAVAGLVAVVTLNKDLARRLGLRRSIDWTNATTLVYEVDLTKAQRMLDEMNEFNEGRPGYQPMGHEPPDLVELISRVKTRIDPEDERDVAVRPLGELRIEIVIPSGGKGKTADAEFADDVRALLSRAGALEFRILANETDDPNGIAEARRMIDDPTPAEKAENDKRAMEGRSPYGPVGTFSVKVGERSEEVIARYEWLELAREEVESLRLSNAYSDPATAPVRRKYETPENVTAFYREVAATRGKTFLNTSRGMEQRLGYSYVLHSRTAAKLAADPVEYYVLTRVSDADSLRVAGDIGLRARETEEWDQRPAVGFSFNKAGAARFGAMTERNQPTHVLRNLAIVMDNKVASAPTLNAVLREGGQISGNFTPQDVRRLVSLLNSGCLNVDLKLVSDTTTATK